MTIVTDYTLDPAAKTITLGAAYSTLKIEEILSIYNLTKGFEIYDRREPRKRRALKNESGNDISISNGVITYYETAGMVNTDKLYIEIGGVSTSLNGTSNTSSNLFTAQSVAASTTVKTTNSISTGQLSKLLCYVSNSGPSTNCTVNIYASPTEFTTGRKKLLATFTIGDGSVTPYETGNGIDPKQLDNYIWGEIINSDAVNAAIITVELSMFR